MSKEAMSEGESFPMIEIFGQHSCHSDGAIRLNAAGAKAFISALQAFNQSGHQTIEVSASDGEGYDLHIIPGEMHDGMDANHYLDAPGLEADSADNLLGVLLAQQLKKE